MTEIAIPDAIQDPQYIEAKTRLIEAQILGQTFDNRLAEALAQTAEWASERERLKFEFDMAGSLHHRTLYLSGGIGDKTAGTVIDTLGRWDRTDPEDREFTIVMTSPGGDVVSGFQLYSYLRGLGERRPLTISASGMCASMATVLHQAASPGRRLIEPGCSYLLHKVSGSISGRSDSIGDTAKWMDQLNRMMAEIFGEKGKKTADEFNDIMDRRETYLTADEVVNEWGLADRVGYTR